MSFTKLIQRKLHPKDSPSAKVVNLMGCLIGIIVMCIIFPEEGLAFIIAVASIVADGMKK